MSKYSPIIGSFKDLLSKVNSGSHLFSITLGDLSNFQTIRKMLENMKVLNTIYLSNDQARLKGERCVSAMEKEKELYTRIGTSLSLLKKNIDSSLNSLRIKLLNRDFNPKTFGDFMQNLCSISFGFKNVIVYNSSTAQPYMTNDTIDYQQFVSNSESNGVKIDAKGNLTIISNEYVCVFLEETRIPVLRIISEHGGNEKLMLLAKHLGMIISEIYEGIYSKKSVCKFLGNLKIILLSYAKKIGLEVVKNEIQSLYDTSVTCSKLSLDSTDTQHGQIIIEGENIIIPIRVQDDEYFCFNFSNFEMNVFSFIENVGHEMGNLANAVDKLSQQSLFVNLLDHNYNDLLLIFNDENELTFQNKEVPVSLKENLSMTEIGFGENPLKLCEIFLKDTDILNDIRRTLESLKNSFENYKFCSGKLNFDILVSKNENMIVKEYLVLIHTHQHKIFKGLNAYTLSYDNEKIQKWLDQMSSALGYSDKFQVEDIVEMMKEKCLEKEKRKKIYDSALDARNTVLREYFKDDSHEVTGKKSQDFKRSGRKSAF